MDRMGEEKDIFEGLGWDKEIVSLGDPRVPFNPSPERERSAAKRYRDDYEMTPFSQSTQAWKWRVEEEERQRYVDKFKMKADMVEKDSTNCLDRDANDAIDLSADILWKINEVDGEDNSIDVEEVEIAMESSKTLSFREKMKTLSLHCLPLKERMKDRTISYIDLLRSDPLPTRTNDEWKPRSSRRLARRKSS